MEEDDDDAAVREILEGGAMGGEGGLPDFEDFDDGDEEDIEQMMQGNGGLNNQDLYRQIKQTVNDKGYI